MSCSRHCSIVTRLMAACAIAALTLTSCEAREWTDATGHYTWKADLFAASEDLAVLRERSGDLHAVQLKELSEDDQKYVKDYLEDDTRVSQDVHTWTMDSGLKIKGTILSYKSGPVEFAHKNGVPYVNNKAYRRLDPVYQKMVIRLVQASLDDSVQTEDDFKAWSRRLRREKRTIQVDGVLMQMKNGDEYSIPLFLFSKADRGVLEAGWHQWNDEEATRQQKAQEDALLRAEASDYQRREQERQDQDREDAEQNRRIQMMQLGLLAVDAGLTSIWEVTLLPAPGTNGRPQRVVVPANDSVAAQQAAMQQYPGYVPGPSRQLSRR